MQEHTTPEVVLSVLRPIGECPRALRSTTWCLCVALQLFEPVGNPLDSICLRC